MTTNSFGGSTVIYDFPMRGRFAAAGRREESTSAASVAAPRPMPVAFGSCWYHDEAIQDVERTRKN